MGKPSPPRKPRVPGNCKGMISLLVEEDEHLELKTRLTLASIMFLFPHRHHTPLVSQPLQLLGLIFTPLALYTLGAQIRAAGAMRFELVPQTIILLLKLLIAPLLTLYLCQALKIPPDVTAVVVVAAATPVGVLLTIFAAEFKSEPEFISAAAVITTALSPLTVTAWIIAMQVM